MEITVTRQLFLTVIVTTMMVSLLHSSHCRATATISWNGNETKTSMCKGNCLIADQYSELELLMDSEASRRILADGYYTDSSESANTAASCGRPYPTCGGPGTGAPIGENCDASSFNRNCHQQNPWAQFLTWLVWSFWCFVIILSHCSFPFYA